MALPQIRDTTTLIEFYRQLQQGCPVLDGRPVYVAAAASTAVQSARHGLGRVYRGGWLTLGPDQSVTLRVLDPNGRAEPETYVYFQLGAATACNATLWAF